MRFRKHRLVYVILRIIIRNSHPQSRYHFLISSLSYFFFRSSSCYISEMMISTTWPSFYFWRFAPSNLMFLGMFRVASFCAAGSTARTVGYCIARRHQCAFYCFCWKIFTWNIYWFFLKYIYFWKRISDALAAPCERNGYVWSWKDSWCQFSCTSSQT